MYYSTKTMIILFYLTICLVMSRKAENVCVARKIRAPNSDQAFAVRRKSPDYSSGALAMGTGSPSKIVHPIKLQRITDTLTFNITNGAIMLQISWVNKLSRLKDGTGQSGSGQGLVSVPSVPLYAAQRPIA
uniref:Uncharacterized protein n=1 Tax=Trichuris muris TaxID=70415 RepID=A0A5S6R260_TRIMR